MTMLLEAGARDVDHRALDAAATAGHLGILRLLLEAGGDAGRALQVACRAGRVEIVRRWFERPAAFYISTDVYRETLIEVSEAAVSTDNDFDILFFLLQGEVLCFLDPGWLVAVVAAVVKGGRSQPGWLFWYCFLQFAVAVARFFDSYFFLCFAVAAIIVGAIARSFRVVVLLLVHWVLSAILQASGSRAPWV